MTIHQAHRHWAADIRPLVIEQYGEGDEPALAESWNDYTDRLCKDGDLTDLQYTHCPAHDDDIPQDDDAERAFILGALGVHLQVNRVDARPDGDDWQPGSRHFCFVIGRGSRAHGGYYSQGPVHTNEPDVCDVFHALLMDASGAEQGFEDWAGDMGLGTDSRKAERTYNACKATLTNLERMFTDQELIDLQDLFADM